MVITGAEPIVVDTGAPIHRDQYLDDLFGIVDPEDVRWVYTPHFACCSGSAPVNMQWCWLRYAQHFA